MQLVKTDKVPKPSKEHILKGINRTLKTAKLIDGFWERWLVHGLDYADLQAVRSHLKDLQQWFHSWESLAKEKVKKAKNLELIQDYKNAEYVYRQAALYYYLNYWINPEKNIQKEYWYNMCWQYMEKADVLSKIQTMYKTILIDDSPCVGRIRIPNNPKGCILIINPIDSSKEELFTYEMDFLNAGFITLSFDGPGQGETFLLNSVVGTRDKWEKFINLLIDYTSVYFEGLPIYLFGTSLGASWVLYGSAHKKVSKAVAVSPAFELEKMNMPAYFMERMECSCIVDEGEKRAIPRFTEINYQAPVMVFHGNKDMMVPDSVMYELFHIISTEKQLIEFENEGHVCNNKLEEIRKFSILWFLGQHDLNRGLS
jgi:hypothetical protein